MTTAITRLNETEGTFSERFPILFEESGRREKAAKVIAVLSDFFGERTSQITVVDIGCSTGIMTRQFAAVFGRVIGLDTDAVGVEHGQKLARQAGIGPDKLRLCAGDACAMPLADESVDAVICNQVYEHVDDQQRLVDEIRRVLCPGGACYFGIGTRHVLIEGHYKLPFLSWMPHRAADLCMRLAGKSGRYDVRLLSYRNLKKLVRGFTVIDYTLPIIKNPERFADTSRGRIRRWVERWPSWLLKAILPAIPIHVWLLVKPVERSSA
ncbi:MAG: class I SAM-dependent methyltransferase [Candidatus Zixiibacteriota bacterium]